MKDLECSVHGTALIEKEVPVFYGMPAADSNIFEIGSKFPHHGLWTIGGCDVSNGIASQSENVEQRAFRP